VWCFASAGHSRLPETICYENFDAIDDDENTEFICDLATRLVAIGQ
jgi:hypothetical protein